jgi:methyltransferase
MVGLYLGLLVVLACERLVELGISRRNAAWSLEQGGIEHGSDHFIYMKLLHTGFFVACALEVVLLERPFIPTLAVPMLGVALAAQAIRYWVIFTLGKRWNVRVIVVPGLPVVSSGPYRYLKHPNYLAVVLEGFAVPLIHTAWITAVAFTLLNAWVLSVRLRCENEALATHCEG